LPKLSEQTLKGDFPAPLAGKVHSTEDVLTYLLAHLNYHLGQVNYLRRFIYKK
jgi:hypothetical protein